MRREPECSSCGVTMPWLNGAWRCPRCTSAITPAARCHWCGRFARREGPGWEPAICCGSERCSTLEREYREELRSDDATETRQALFEVATDDGLHLVEKDLRLSILRRRGVDVIRSRALC